MKKLRLNRRVKKAFRGSSRGFTLIEVVIAMLLLGIIGVAVLSSLSYASVVLISVDRRATAESLARSQMESIKNEEYIDYEQTGHANYTLIETPEGYDIEPIAVLTLEVGLQKIKLIVSYDIVRSNNKIVGQNFTLEDYKRNPET